MRLWFTLIGCRCQWKSFSSTCVWKDYSYDSLHDIIVSYLPVCGRRILLIYPIISSERYSKAVDVHPTAYLTMSAGMRSLSPSKQKYLCDLWCVYKLVSSYILHTVRRVPTPGVKMFSQTLGAY